MPTRPSSEVVAPLPELSYYAVDTLSWNYSLPLSPGDSPRATSPMDDYALESQFCRDFFCCNIKLPNLHDLIQHYEERHVKFEDEHGILDDWSAPVSRVNSPMHASRQVSAALADIYSLEVGSMSQLSQDVVSAFETAVIRNSQNPRKRKVSLNACEAAIAKKTLSNAREALCHSFGGVAGLSAEELDEHLQRAIAYSFDSHVNHTYSSSEQEHPSPWLIRSATMEPTLAVQPSQTNAVAAAAAAAVVSEVGGPTIVVPMPPMPNVTSVGRPPSTPANTVPGITGTLDKPYRCEVPGCDKTYKNKNGLKYHVLNGHIDPVLKEAASQERKQQRLEERASRFAFYPQHAPQPTYAALLNAKAAASTDTTAIIDVVSVQADPVPVASISATGLLTPPTPSSPMQPAALPMLPPSSAPVSVPMTPCSTAPSSPVDEVLKPYRCAVSDCGKTYKNLGGLKYHIDKVHDGNPLAMAMGRKKITSSTSTYAKPLSHTPSVGGCTYAAVPAAATAGSLSAGLFVRVPEAVPHLQQKLSTALLSSTTNIIGAGMLPAPLPNNNSKWMNAAYATGRPQAP